MTRPFRWSRSWDVSRYATALAVTTAAILLAVGVIGAWMSERDFRSQKMQQAQAHARVLAASVSAALAFDETPEAEQAISALRANPEIGAVGIYGPEGVPFILRGNETRDPPLMLSEGTAPHYDSGSAIATAPVMQAGQQLGRVYVELSAGSGPAQWMRYVGVALLLAMAAVLVGAIAVSQRSLAAANKELARRAATLTQANAQLTDEMAARKKAERALAQAQKMEAIGQLTGGLAHDFNNILAAISGGVRLIERTGDPDLRAQVKASLADAIERGARLTRQLLAFARGQNLEARVTDPCERIVAMVELLRRSLGEDVGVDTSFPGLRWYVLVDPDQFELVILNLAVNARDAMPEGGLLRIVCSNVVRSEAPAGEFVRVSIVDNGEGMSPETVERAFEPFFTTKEVGKGTGLGLAQVYAFARQAGGLAWIESELGGGTAVHLDLPRSLSPADTTNHPAPESDAEEAPPPAGEGRRVLIVEDDESVARMVCGLLESHGYVCDRVACARDAIEASQRERYDLVFTDIVMPGGMSGIDLAREFRRLMPALPVLLTTGFTGKARIEPGEFQILYKPWTPDDLLNAIHRGMAAGQAASGAREKNPIRQQDAERST